MNCITACVLRKFKPQPAGNVLTFSTLSVDPKKEVESQVLESLGFQLHMINTQKQLIRCTGPLACLPAATKCIGTSFLPEVECRTVSNDFEVLSRAFPEHCKILNKKSILSITIFRHAASDFKRARPFAITQPSNESKTKPPLIVLPDMNELGIPKMGIIIAESTTENCQIDADSKFSESHCDMQTDLSSSTTLLSQLNGHDQRIDADNPQKVAQDLSLSFDLVGASTNPSVGLRSPAQSYCRASRPKKNEF